MTFALAFLALLIEAVAGYPQALVARIGHPVTWIGALIARTEAVWNEGHLSFAHARLRGILALATVLLVTLSITLLIDHALGLVLPVVIALAVKAVLASTLLAGRSLDEDRVAVRDVLADARGSGRDPVFVVLDLLGDANNHAARSLPRPIPDRSLAPRWRPPAGPVSPRLAVENNRVILT